MEFAPSGVELSFEVSFDSPSLYVGMSVYDTTGIPVLVTGPNPMANVAGNTYVGKFTPSAGKSYLIVKMVYTNNSYSVVDPGYAPGSETIQSGGVDVTYLVPSLAQTNKTFVGLPQLSGALLEWQQQMIFTVITKSVVNFEAKEVSTNYAFEGVWQPFSSAQMKLRPEGQRTWSWFMLHTFIDLPLKTDDVVYYSGVKYRVMDQSDYGPYGFYQYSLVEDWVMS